MTEPAAQTPQLPRRTSLSEMEKQIQDYLNCWEEQFKSKFKNGSDGLNRLHNYVTALNTECERNFLMILRYPMHTLEYEAFRKLPILLLDTQKYNINYDHFYYWAFATDVFDFFQNKISAVYDREIQNRLHLMMDTFFLRSKRFQLQENFEHEANSRAAEVLTPRLRNVSHNDFLIGAHLAYPLIEGIVRRMLPTMVGVDGVVKAQIANFTSADGKQVNGYSVNGRRNRINAIDDLLRILEHATSDSQLKSDLQDYRTHFNNAYSQLHLKQHTAYEIISEYRNSLLHGQALFQVLYAALTNLICLLLSSQIPKSDYDSKYNDLMKNISDNYGRRVGMSEIGYYPPF